MTEPEAAFEADRLLPAPAERVWSVLADLANPALAVGFAGIEVLGTGAGALRTLTLPEAQGGGTVTERIEEFTPGERSYLYRVLTFADLPFAAYAGRLRVLPAPGDQAVIAYSAAYRPLRLGDAETCRRIAADGFERLVENLARATARAPGR
jgi:hypothetical protein